MARSHCNLPSTVFANRTGEMFTNVVGRVNPVMYGGGGGGGGGGGRLEEEEEEGLVFKADAVNEEDPERDGGGGGGFTIRIHWIL